MKDTKQLASSAIIAALYIAISLIFAPLSFGLVQLRLSEMFNHLVIFSKRYIWALTIGCFIVNIFSPLGVIDMIVGTLGTLFSGLCAYHLIKLFQPKSKFQRYFISSLSQTIGVVFVSAELAYFYHFPFLLAFGSVFLGEMASMVLGAFIVNYLTKYIDFEKGRVTRYGI